MRTFFITLFLACITHFCSGQENNNLFFVFLNTNPDRATLKTEEVRKIQEMHIANIDSLYQKGKLIAAGSFNSGGGILILVAEDIENARQLLMSDPAVQAKRFITELYPLRVDHGRLCWIEGESGMQEYVFTRLTPFPMPMADSTQIQKIIEAHNNYITDLNDSIPVLIEGYLGPDTGRFIVFGSDDMETTESLVQNDPYIRNLLHAYELKKIWIAGETFCIHE